MFYFISKWKRLFCQWIRRISGKSHTISTFMTLEYVEASGMFQPGDDLFITNGAKVTCKDSSILIGNIVIDDEELILDGTVFSGRNTIYLIGEQHG